MCYDLIKARKGGGGGCSYLPLVIKKILLREERERVREQSVANQSVVLVVRKKKHGEKASFTDDFFCTIRHNEHVNYRRSKNKKEFILVDTD